MKHRKSLVHYHGADVAQPAEQLIRKRTIGDSANSRGMLNPLFLSWVTILNVLC